MEETLLQGVVTVQPSTAAQETTESTPAETTAPIAAEESTPAVKGEGEDAHNPEEEEEVDETEGDEEDEDGETYAAEYRSLLCRVAEMETQEEQRLRQQGVTLRMAQREARLMSRVVRQQQAFLSAHTSQKEDADASAHTPALVAPHALSSSPSKTAAQVIMSDARLSCLAYRAERTQQRQRKLTDASALLTAYTTALQSDQIESEQLRERAADVFATLCDEAACDFTLSACTPAAEVSTLPHQQQQPPPPPPSTSADSWQKHSGNLTALGGTLAKVHTMFQDDVSRANMAVVAAHLTHVGRKTQRILHQLQRLAMQEAALDTALHRSRGCTVEWGIYAAHVQQARELADLHSPQTVAEMRSMAVQKILMRRQQELHNALAVALLRTTERTAADKRGDIAPVKSFCVTSPAAEVTVERVKAAAETCAQQEALRDRLRHELLFLKKCARRELGPSWMAQMEVASLRRSAADGGVEGSEDVAFLTATLAANLRRSTYDSVARVVRLVIEPPSSPMISAVEGVSESAVSSPTSASARLPARVQVVALAEGVQTRVNSLASLLVDNATHWQRVVDARVEAEWVSGPRDETSAAEEVGEEGGSAPAEGEQLASRSLLLDLEQQLLDTMQAAEGRLLADVNATLAQLHARCTTPLKEMQREVVLVVRLLQLADEAVVSASESPHREEVARTTTTTTTTAALESVVRLLQSSTDPSPLHERQVEEEEEATTADAISALLSTAEHRPSSSSAPPIIRLPCGPYQAAELQSALRTVSREWQQQLRTDVATLRSTVAATQSDLEMYAPYSMAEVPALLEKARAAVAGLKAQLAARTAQSGRAALLSAQLQEQRQLLDRHTGTERAALSAAVQVAQGKQAALQAEVTFLRACVALVAEEGSHRRDVCEAEAAAWAAGMAEVEDCVLQSLEAAAALVVKAEAAPAADGEDGVAATTPATAEAREEEGEGDDGAYAYDGMAEEEGQQEEDENLTARADAEEAEEGDANAFGGFPSAHDEEREEEDEEDEQQQQQQEQQQERECADGAEEDAGPSAEALRHTPDPSLLEGAEETAAQRSESGADSTFDAEKPLSFPEDTARTAGVSEEEIRPASAPASDDMEEEQQPEAEHAEGGPLAEDTQPEEEEEAEAAVPHTVKENEEQTMDVPLTYPLVTKEEGIARQDEEAVANRSEKNVSRGILDDSMGILGAGGGGGVLPVLPSPAPTGGVLEDNNPFYSGFGFGEE